jgi:hypothetical protein
LPPSEITLKPSRPILGINPHIITLNLLSFVPPARMPRDQIQQSSSADQLDATFGVPFNVVNVEATQLWIVLKAQYDERA